MKQLPYQISPNFLALYLLEVLRLEYQLLNFMFKAPGGQE